MNFKNWLENIEAKRAGIKDTILNFLKDKLHLDDDEAILSLPIKSIGKSVLTDLIARGLVNTSDDSIVQSIKNGSGTVAELIDRLAGVSPQIQSAPVMLNTDEEWDSNITVYKNWRIEKSDNREYGGDIVFLMYPPGSYKAEDSASNLVSAKRLIDGFRTHNMREGVPAGWEPSPRMAAGAFASALHKIARNPGQMPFTGNFVDTGVFQIRFGLDQQELDVIKKHGYLVRGADGWNIDKFKFQNQYYQLMNTISQLKDQRKEAQRKEML